MIVRGLLTLALLAAACHAPKPLPPMPPRIQTSPPEQTAALNDAARLGLQANTERWQIEAAKELKEAAEWRKDTARSKTAVIPMPPPNDSGVFVDGGHVDAGRD